MKKFIPLVVLAVLGFGTVAVHAQTQPAQPRRLSSMPVAFRTFYAKFRTAVIRGDRPTIVSMTRFPFEYGWDAGDEGVYTRREFLANFRRILGGKKIFRQANPKLYVDGNSYDIVDESDASHYMFEKTPTGYKFTSLIAEP